MLHKIFGNKKSNDISTISTQARLVSAPSGPVLRQSRALKIVHAGGHAEYYYMAIPAAKVMEKHPSFTLARPEIFRSPWDSVVRPEQILLPGQKYYLVPRRSVKKLRRRIRRPTAAGPGFSTLTEDASQHMDSRSLSSISGILVKPGPKVKARNLHVRFFGIETTNQKPGPGSGSGPPDKKSGNRAEKSSKERLMQKNQIAHEKKRRARNENAWEPSLHSITE